MTASHIRYGQEEVSLSLTMVVANVLYVLANSRDFCNGYSPFCYKSSL